MHDLSSLKGVLCFIGTAYKIYVIINYLNKGSLFETHCAKH